MTQMLRRVIGEDITLHLDLAPRLPAVLADEVMLEQVLLNLAVNSRDAMPKGGSLTISTALADIGRSDAKRNPEARAGRYVCLSVADTGCGMDELTRAQIFDPFFSTKFTGRGLGLPAVLGVARGHRGYVQVRSEPGHGSTVRLLFPVPPEREARAERQAGTSGQARPAAPLVLVVDDEGPVRSLTVRLVERCGYRAASARDGLEALHQLQERLPDVACVILDMTMPRLGGEETLREIRKLSPELPVLVSSGFEGAEVIERLAGLSPSGFLQKPYQLAEVRSRLQALLSERGTLPDMPVG
jgi:CheY-like chemotaxis protein